MKKRTVYILRTLCFLITVALIIGFLQEYVLCHADHNRERIKGFFEEDKGSLDLVLLGASEVYSDFAPGYAYNQNGICSYLFATQSNTIPNYKSQLKNILKRQKNALIVIEVNGALYGDEEEIYKDANLHNYSDNVPLDITKLEWAAENTGEKAAEYIFPIIKYHILWNNLGEDMKYRKTIANNKLRGYNYLKGILNETAVFRSTQKSMNSSLAEMSQTSKKPLTGIEETKLRELLEYCRENDLQNIVFARFPHIVVKRTFSRFERSNTIGDIVNEYDYDYLNLEKDIEMTGLDEEKDFYNLDHLNIYGQKKFTKFLTEYLIANYSLSPHTLKKKEKEEWDICGKYYDAYSKYSETLINTGEKIELSEDCELTEKLKSLIPQS